MVPISKHPLLPDVEIFYKGTRDALKHQEFQKPNELSFAKNQLREGLARAKALLKNGKAPWTKQSRARRPGLPIRDRWLGPALRTRHPQRATISPGINPTASTSGSTAVTTRSTKSTSWNAVRTQAGQYTPAETIVLHPYARFSNANKFAGEIDCLEVPRPCQEELPHR